MSGDDAAAAAKRVRTRMGWAPAELLLLPPPPALPPPRRLELLPPRVAALCGGGPFVWRLAPLAEDERRAATQLRAMPPEKQIAVVNGVPLPANAFFPLLDGGMLKDEVLNAAVFAAQRRAPAAVARTTFFAELLVRDGPAAVARAKDLERGVDVDGAERVLVPLHFGMHYALAVVDKKRREVARYDSLPGCWDRGAQRKWDAVVEWARERFPGGEWVADDAPRGPRQNNGVDCGVFVCANAMAVALGEVPCFAADNMPALRVRMAFEVLSFDLT